MDWAPPSAGALREKISFERRLSTPDGAGNTESTWIPLCGPFSARVRPINGREEILVGKLSGVQPFEIIVRYSSATAGVTTEDSAIDPRTGKRFDITAIQNPDERHMWLSMLAKTGTSEE